MGIDLPEVQNLQINYMLERMYDCVIPCNGLHCLAVNSL